MADDTELVEVVVLRDGEGRYYLLPRTTLEQARVSDRQQVALEEALGDADATGFSSFALGGLTALGLLQAQPVGGVLEIISPRDAASGLATGKR